MKKLRPWQIFVAVLVPVLLICVIFNVYIGNPVSSLIATLNIRSHVERSYPGNGFDVPWASYNSRDRGYHSIVSAPGSADTRFRVSWRGGNVTDDYAAAVAGREVMLARLAEELRGELGAFLDDYYPHAARQVGAYLMPGDTEVISALPLDMQLDFYNLPLPAIITVWMREDAPDYIMLAERLCEVHALLSSNGIEIAEYSMIIENAAGENSVAAYGVGAARLEGDELDIKKLADQLAAADRR